MSNMMARIGSAVMDKVVAAGAGTVGWTMPLQRDLAKFISDGRGNGVKKIDPYSTGYTQNFDSDGSQNSTITVQVYSKDKATKFFTDKKATIMGKIDAIKLNKDFPSGSLMIIAEGKTTGQKIPLSSITADNYDKTVLAALKGEEVKAEDVAKGGDSFVDHLSVNGELSGSYGWKKPLEYSASISTVYKSDKQVGDEPQDQVSIDGAIAFEDPVLGGERAVGSVAVPSSTTNPPATLQGFVSAKWIHLIDSAKKFSLSAGILSSKYNVQGIALDKSASTASALTAGGTGMTGVSGTYSHGVSEQYLVEVTETVGKKGIITFKDDSREDGKKDDFSFELKNWANEGIAKLVYKLSKQGKDALNGGFGIVGATLYFGYLLNYAKTGKEISAGGGLEVEAQLREDLNLAAGVHYSNNTTVGKSGYGAGVKATYVASKRVDPEGTEKPKVTAIIRGAVGNSSEDKLIPDVPTPTGVEDQTSSLKKPAAGLVGEIKWQPTDSLSVSAVGGAMFTAGGSKAAFSDMNANYFVGGVLTVTFDTE